MTARRVYVGAPPPDPTPGVYGRGVRSHDPYRAHRRYDVPQLTGTDPDAWPLTDRPVKILAVVDRYPPVSGHMAGGETMLRHMLRSSLQAGHEVVVTSSTPEPYEHEGVKVVPFATGRHAGADADVIVGHLMWTRQAVEMAAAARRPLIYLVHNDRQIRHWTLVRSNITMAIWNSEWIQASYQAKWDGAGVVVRPPTRCTEYALARDPWTATHVTLVNVNPEKGADVFYRLAGAPPARRYLAVEGAYGDQVKPGRDHPNVDWQPQTPRIVADVYERTRVLLMPSVYESYGCVAAEAMSSGIPVVAHPTPGLREVLGPAGIFRDRADIDGWREALAMLDDRDFYREASMGALQRAVELTRVSGDDLATWDRAVRACGHLTHSASQAVA